MGVALGQANAAWMLTEGYGYEGVCAACTCCLLLLLRSQGFLGGSLGTAGEVETFLHICYPLATIGTAVVANPPSVCRPRGRRGCAAAVQAGGPAGRPRGPAVHRRFLLVGGPAV